MWQQKASYTLNKERLEMFSDGVMAIAITLLVLEIKIPTHEEVVKAGGLYNFLYALWPNYMAYVMTFFQVGVYWSNHHWLFTLVKGTNHVFNMLNVLFLMTIAFMPFTNAIFGDYFTGEYHNAATTVYAVGLLMPLVTISLVVLYAEYKHRLVLPGLTQRFLNGLYLKLFLGILVSLAAVLMSFSYPKVSFALTLVDFFMFLIPPKPPEFES